MKSIQTKFIVLILGCILLSAGVNGGAGILTAQRVVDEDSAKIMNLLCSGKTQEINALLSRIQQSVRMLSVYALSQFESVERLKKDPEYVNEFTRQLEAVALNTASNTEGAMSVYVRFNPELAHPTSGLFWSKPSLEGSFHQNTPTDFSGYSPSDVEHVGWYYIPVKNGSATWMEPYVNKNINVRMISFVIPLTVGKQVIGIVGMDIDFNVVTDIVQEMQIYRTGYAFLMSKTALVMYHRKLEMGTPIINIDAGFSPILAELQNTTSGSSLFSYNWQGEEKKMAFRELKNGMRLVVTSPVSEIDATKRNLVLEIGTAFVVISTFAVLLTLFMTRRLIRPLRELNEAAKKIAAGDLSISLTQKTKDEVGSLAESFQQTVDHLQKYISYINGLAYRDSLTGVKNKTAYHDAEARLEEQMRTGRPDFALVMFDINGLKEVNDTCGHDFGDMLIVNSCRLICQAFQHSPVYRIGGDEFVVILEGTDYEQYSALLRRFEEEVEAYNQNIKMGCHISVARGIAIYNSEIDLVFANVFKRADDAMYQNKAAMKGLAAIPIQKDI